MWVEMDEETWIPRRVHQEWAPNGRYPEGREETWMVTQMEVGLVPRSLFRQGLEPGDLAGSDQGFRPITTEASKSIASYVPPLPTWVPEASSWRACPT